MAEWTAAKRKKYLEEHPENFAGPDGSYPIEDGNDVKDAWDLAGHAPNSGAVRAKVKSIAKRLGLTSSLPDTATEDDSKERSMGEPSTPAQDALTRAAPSHEPVDDDTTHSHSHDANGSQGGDKTHEHSHFHAKGTASHDHPDDHKDDAAERAAGGESLVTPETPLHLYAPIVRLDEKEWVIEGQVTSDQVDDYGTIFDYEASKEAFKTWRMNIREMHKNEAVGRAIEVVPDDASRTISLRARISRGARSTWEKILDGTLSGFSVSAHPRHVETTQVTRNGKSVPVYKVKKWAEVSVVDSPGSPGCDFQIVRADGILTDLINTSEEDPVPATLERAGKSISAATKGKLHESIGHTLQAAKSQMQNCADAGCDDCASALKQMDPDSDGDVDAFGGAYGDTDGDAASLSATDDMDRAVVAALERVLPGAIERALGPAYSRLQGIAGALARSNPASSSTLDSLIESTITRALDAAKTANETSLSEVRADLSAVKETVGKIADTPVPGAPVMNGATAPRPVDKTLPTDRLVPPQQRNMGAVERAMLELQRRGQLDTYDQQIDALGAGFSMQQQGGR